MVGWFLRPRPPGNPVGRMRVLTFVALFVLSLFGAQLVRIQGLSATELADQALRLRKSTDVTPSLRGSILSADGIVLASSIVKETIVADPTAVCTYGISGATKCDPEKSGPALAKATAKLAPILQLSEGTIAPKLAGAGRYQVLSRNVTPQQAHQIELLRIPGIYRDTKSTRSERVYPQGSTAAPLVGFLYTANKDGESPGGGIEALAQRTLKGTPGSVSYQQSPTGERIPGAPSTVVPAVDGRDVVLTINSNLQWYATNAIAQQVEKTRALSGMIVVMDVRSGDLRAVASYPSFDPMKPDPAKHILQNLAFADMFEPGSTAKIMTVAAALEEKTITPDTPVVIPNHIVRYDEALHDSHRHPTEYRTVSGTLAESSNIGTVLVSETMKTKTIETYLRRFGLGALSDVRFPGEQKGLLPPSEEWSGTQRATIAYGQGVSVTAIQAASVFSTIANGGLRVPPRLIAGTKADDGTYTESPPAADPVRVISPQVASEVTRMLEGAASDEGTAPKAQIPGYRVAGKTGTAEYYDQTVGRYRGKTASFIGYAPADKPELVVAVILQKPIRGYYGGVVAAPVFHDVMKYALQELRIPPTGTTPSPITLKIDATTALRNPRVLRDRGTLTSR